MRHALVSAYGINEKSKIAIIGGGDNSVPPPKATPERASQASTIVHIRNEVDKVRQTLRPNVDDFLAVLASLPTATTTADSPRPASGPSSSARDKQQDLDREHARLAELLLQSLLRLDAINADGEWEEARRERKGAVREVQSLLDKLDQAWHATPKL